MEGLRNIILALVLCSSIRHFEATPLLPSDVVLLVPHPGPGPKNMPLKRLVQTPVRPAMPIIRPSRNAVPGFMNPSVAHIVVLKPVIIGQSPLQTAIQPESRALKQFPFPFVSHASKINTQAVTQSLNSTESEKPDPKQAAGETEPVRTTGLSFYIPVKVNGSTVFVERDVAVPIATTSDEELTNALISPNESEGEKSEGTPLHGLTREELSEIIRLSVLQVMKENGHLTLNETATSTSTTAASTDDSDVSPTTMDPEASEEEVSQEEVGDSIDGEEEREDSEGTEETGGQEPAAHESLGAASEASEASGASGEEKSEYGEDEDHEDSQDEEEEGEKSGSSTAESGATEASTQMATESSQQKQRRQLPATSVTPIPGKRSFKKFKSNNSQSSSRPGVMGLKIFKPISTTPDPEAVSPVDRPDMMDPLILTDFSDQLLKNKQIVIVDRDKHKNRLFLNAIKQVLQDFEQMYQIPHDDEYLSSDREHSSNSLSDSASLTRDQQQEHLNETTTSSPSELEAQDNSLGSGITQVPLN